MLGYVKINQQSIVILVDFILIVHTFTVLNLVHLYSSHLALQTCKLGHVVSLRLKTNLFKGSDIIRISSIIWMK